MIGRAFRPGRTAGIALALVLAFAVAWGVVPATAIAEQGDDATSPVGLVAYAGEDGAIVLGGPEEAAPSSESHGKDELVEEFGVAPLIQEGAFPEEDGSLSDGLSAQASYDANGAKAAIKQGLINCATSISLSAYNVPKDSLFSLYTEVVNENPELFYVQGECNFVYSPEGTVIEVRPTYGYSTSAIATMKPQFEQAIKNACTWVPSGATEIQKIKAMHDWLVRNVTYDVATYLSGARTGGTPYNAYGALVSKKAVCQGYCLAFKCLMDRLGVKCTILTSSSANHAWNAVMVDSKWYIVDVTWDDPIYNYNATRDELIDGGFNLTYTGGKPHTEYFMKSRKAAMDADGSTNGAHSSWSPSSVTCTSTIYDSVDANARWGNYSGPASGSTTKSLASASIQVEAASFIYTGWEMTPKCTVKLGGRILAEGTDYTLSYKNNTDVGTATVTAKGTGNYTGTKSATFQICRSFLDVPTSTPHAQDIEWLKDNGITTGYSDKTFRPTSEVKRCDMAAFLYRIARGWGLVDDSWKPSAKQMKAFTDVNSSTPHAREVWWLAATGISTGYSDGTFRPYENIKRQDMAAFLYRMAIANGMAAWTPTAAQRTAFTDVNSSTPHAREVWWLAATGISTGYSNGTFRPTALVVRQDMAAFLHRLDGLM